MLVTICKGSIFAAIMTAILYAAWYYGKDRLLNFNRQESIAFAGLIFWSLLVIYMTLLTYSFDPMINDIGFTPFHTLKEIFVYGQKGLVFQLLINIAIFVPFGFLIPYLFEEVRSFSMICTIGFMISLSIECIQLFVGRSFDFDDIICNTLGAMAGYVLLVLFLAGRKACQNRRLKAKGSAQLS